MTKFLVLFFPDDRLLANTTHNVNIVVKFRNMKNSIQFDYICLCVIRLSFTPYCVCVCIHVRCSRAYRLFFCCHYYCHCLFFCCCFFSLFNSLFDQKCLRRSRHIIFVSFLLMRKNLPLNRTHTFNTYIYTQWHARKHTHTHSLSHTYRGRNSGNVNNSEYILSIAIIIHFRRHLRSFFFALEEAKPRILSFFLSLSLSVTRTFVDCTVFQANFFHNHFKQTSKWMSICKRASDLSCSKRQREREKAKKKL